MLTKYHPILPKLKLFKRRSTVFDTDMRLKLSGKKLQTFYFVKYVGVVFMNI